MKKRKFFLQAYRSKVRFCFHIRLYRCGEKTVLQGDSWQMELKDKYRGGDVAKALETSRISSVSDLLMEVHIFYQLYIFMRFENWETVPGLNGWYPSSEAVFKRRQSKW